VASQLPGSEWEQVLVALAGKIQSGVPNCQAVKLRRRPQMVQGDPLPLVIVAPSESGETLELETFCKEVSWGYRVEVACYLAANRNLELDFTWLMFRQYVRDLVYSPLALPSGDTLDWEIETNGPFMQSGNDQTTQTSVFSVIYKVGSQRS